jgi:hypothetical protein
MKVLKFLLLVSVLTAFIFLYGYQQSEIFRLGYLIDKKQEKFQELLDKNTLLRYNVQKNASLIRLGAKFSGCADFQMPDTYRLVKVVYPAANLKLAGQFAKKESIFVRIFGVKRQAEAKTINR